MPSTIEYRKTLGKDGAGRKALCSIWGAWADEYCDGLLFRLISPVESCKISLWKQRDGTFQVNVDSNGTGGYTNDISSDALGTIGERLQNAEVVCDPDAVQAGDDG